MNRLEEIALEDFRTDSFTVFERDWFLLTAGDFAENEFNTMTVGWGFLGTMWGRPMAMAVVRPQRYTMEFIERFDSFTLSGFGSGERRALALLGRASGRDGDKITESGLTAVASVQVAAPTFQEAHLVLECRKTAVGNLKGADFIQKKLIREFYPDHDYHRTVFGEVVRIAGTPEYKK